jgi:hypothetical protein
MVKYGKNMVKMVQIWGKIGNMVKIIEIRWEKSLPKCKIWFIIHGGK